MARFFHLAPTLAFLLFSLDGWAVKPYTPIIATGLEAEWRWRQYPEVADLGVLCIESGADDTLWFGGDKGVMSYDGWTWVSYGENEGLDGGVVHDLLQTSSGKLFAGTEKGLYEFGADDGMWRLLKPEGRDFSFYIHRIAERDDGSLMMATVLGMLVFDGEHWTLWSSADMLRAPSEFGGMTLRALPDDALPQEPWMTSPGIMVIENDFISAGKEAYPLLIWAVAENGPAARKGIEAGDRLLAIDGNQPYQPSFALQGPVSDPVSLTIRKRLTGEIIELSVDRELLAGGARAFSITDVIQSRNGSIWCADARRGSVIQGRIEEGEAVWKLHRPGSGFTRAGATRLHEASDGRIWKIAQSGNVPLEVFEEGVGWSVTYEAAPNLLDDNIHTSIIETDDALWIGGHDGVIHLYREGHWERFTASDIPTPKVRVIDMERTRRGDIWVAGMRGRVSRFQFRTPRWTTFEGLMYCSTDEAGNAWFTSDLSRVILNSGSEWWEFDVRDGLPSDVRKVIVTSRGIIAVGGQSGVAAMAEFDPVAFERGDSACWKTRLFPGFALRFDENALYEGSDGSLWLGASGAEEGHSGGFVQLIGDEARIHTGTGAPLGPYAMIQDAEGVYWSGGPLRSFDGTRWSGDGLPEEVHSHVHDLALTSDGALWVATRFYGAMRKTGDQWDRFTIDDGLPDNRIEGLFEDSRGVLWASTPRGVARFDGVSWNHDNYDFNVAFDNLRGSIRPGANEEIWFARKDRSTRYLPDRTPPRTRIIESRDSFSDVGTLTFRVAGRDFLDETAPEDIAFSFRLDDGPWSGFSRNEILQVPSVGYGVHSLEVRSRDWDYNVDTRPARLSFVVVRPVWQRPWFIVGIVLVFGFLVVQTVRLIERDRRMLAVNQELRLRGAELEAANEELRGFSYAVSHDLRAPLRHLAGFSSMLVDDFGEKLGEDGGRMIGRIKNATHRLEDLVEGLLTLCRSTNSELQHANVDVTRYAKELAVEAEREYWKERGTFEIQEHMKVTGDPRLIRVVLENLLGNAAKFSARVDNPLVKVDLLRNGAEVIIRVADNGAGFNMDYAENLFQPFRRLHAYDEFAGTGIGLATVSRIVRRHGGRIWAEAEEGKGATFSVAFPERPA